MANVKKGPKSSKKNVKQGPALRLAHLASASQAAVYVSPALAKLYGHTMASVAKKSVIRLDKQVKARFCKRCFSPLVPGLTAAMRIVDKSGAGNMPLIRKECFCGRRRSVKRVPIERAQCD